MIGRRSSTAACAAAVALLFVAVAALATGTVHATGVTIISGATLDGDGGGSFASHTAPITAPLAACTSYTLRLNYTMQLPGTPVESGIGVEVWNNEGDALLTSSPFGERIWFGPGQKYYLKSFRRADDPAVEEIRFQIPCGVASPNYSFRVFNYLPGNTMTYSLSMPGGEEG